MKLLDVDEKNLNALDRITWGSRPDLVESAALTGEPGRSCDLYDADGRLAYRGAFDASTPGNRVPVTGDLLSAAIRQVLAHEPVPEPHRPSMGCSIKWRA